MCIRDSYIGTIPVAVFVGILFKVGYDVFDWEPVVAYTKKLFGRMDLTGSIQVSHIDMFFIVGTAGVTLLRDLNTAVICLTILFYLVRMRVKIPDLKALNEA